MYNVFDKAILQFLYVENVEIEHTVIHLEKTLFNNVTNVSKTCSRTLKNREANKLF